MPPTIHSQAFVCRQLGSTLSCLNLLCHANQHSRLYLLCSGEVLLADGKTRKSCPLKVVPYDSQVGVCRAEKELSALHTALGQPQLVQGVAFNTGAPMASSVSASSLSMSMSCICLSCKHTAFLAIIMEHTAFSGCIKQQARQEWVVVVQSTASIYFLARANTNRRHAADLSVHMRHDSCIKP